MLLVPACTFQQKYVKLDILDTRGQNSKKVKYELWKSEVIGEIIQCLNDMLISHKASIILILRTSRTVRQKYENQSRYFGGSPPWWR